MLKWIKQFFLKLSGLLNRLFPDDLHLHCSRCGGLLRYTALEKNAYCEQCHTTFEVDVEAGGIGTVTVELTGVSRYGLPPDSPKSQHS